GSRAPPLARCGVSPPGSGRPTDRAGPTRRDQRAGPNAPGWQGRADGARLIARSAEAHRRVSCVQATVKDFDADTGAGSVLLDDGREVTFDGAAFAAGGLRLLRFGQ